MLFTKLLGLAAMALSGLVQASPVEGVHRRASSSDRLVFCHFMIGICGDRSSSADYDDDMQRAKAAGIDAFALNIGVDGYTDTQLGFAYDSAARNGMSVFISFDFNWYKLYQGSDVGSKIAQYKTKPAQLYLDNRVFASSFAGDGVDVAALKSAAGENVFWVPNFHPGQGDVSVIDGALNWMAWPNNGNNKAPNAAGNVSVEAGDAAYQNYLGSKPYLAPVSPWFSTHFGPEVSFSKNWVFPGGSLIYDRWTHVLQAGFPMVEMITWNDYGESHYMGPLSSKHYDDGSSKWVNDMPHDGWLDLAKPYIAAYKARATSVTNYIKQDQLVYWYRRNLKSLNCDATDTTFNEPANNGSGNYFEGRPDGWNTMDDTVYVVALLTSPGTVSVSSGGNTMSQNVPAGATLIEVPAGIGKQMFSLSRGGSNVYQATSLMDITTVCPCGLYNYNAYVGTVPAGFNDPLGPDGVVSLPIGLHVTTCQATPSLGTNPPVTGTTSTTITGGGGSGPTSTTTTTTSTKSSSTSTVTSTVTSTMTTSKTTSTAPTSSSGSGSGTCNGGTVAPGETGNYIGLCQFTCKYGYCPPGPCVCTSYGTPAQAPPSTGTKGCPLPGEGGGYIGLCSYSCDHGYCPGTACTSNC